MNGSNIHGWVLWITPENEEDSWGIHRVYESFEEAKDVLYNTYKKIIENNITVTELMDVFSGSMPTIMTKHIYIMEVTGYIPSVNVDDFLESQSKILINDTDGNFCFEMIDELGKKRLQEKLQDAYLNWLMEEGMFPLSWKMLPWVIIEVEMELKKLNES